MRVSLEVKSNLDIPAYIRAIQDPKLWKFAASEWRRLIEPYVPMDTGTLKDTVDVQGGRGNGQIVYKVPYARYQYEGHFNHRKDLHPKASRQWDKAALPTEEPKLIRSLERYVKERVNFNG